MDTIFYRPDNAWVGDLIPYWDNGTYYAFYLHDPRIRDGEYAEETTWHLFTTKDFGELEYKGEAIKRGADDKPNKNAFTGSVIKDKDGRYYAFYTAYNADIKIGGKSIQSVMKASGSDLEHLETDEDFLFVADGKVYEEFDWRDPYVFWYEPHHCYYMLLAARIKNSGELRGGCIALCKSTDLIHWEYEKPFFDPKMYVTMECPEVFQMGNYWYLVFSTFSDRFVTHYRIADDPFGEWRIPDDDVFDTRADYAIKTASDGDRRFAFGWIASKYGNTDSGPWEWGGTFAAHEIIQDKTTGELSVKVISELKKKFHKPYNTEEWNMYNVQHYSKDMNGLTMSGNSLGAGLIKCPKDTFSMELECSIEDNHEFGIVLHGDKGMEKGYFLRFNLQNQLVAWDLWPRTQPGRYQWQIKGDIPYQIETARNLPKTNKYHILILREGDICVVYINNQIALSTRLYDYKGGYAGVYFVQGKVKVNNLEIMTR